MSTTSPPGHFVPKAMSSRLLTMKFMQRAAVSSPTIPIPSSPDEPSPKRRKTEADSSPSRLDVDSLADRAAVQVAMAIEEAKRQAALEKQAAEAGDTRWLLSFEDQKDSAGGSPLALRIVPAGFANIDASPLQSKIVLQDDLEEDKPVVIGRRSFGRFNKVLEKQQNPSFEASSESDSENEDDDENSSEESESDPDDPTNELIKASKKEAADRLRAERKANKQAAKGEASVLARKRRMDEVNLNGLSSLTGRQDKAIVCFNCGGPHVKKDCPQLSSMACYNCGGPHQKKNCPQLKRPHQGGDDGPPRKARRANR